MFVKVLSRLRYSGGMQGHRAFSYNRRLSLQESGLKSAKLSILISTVFPTGARLCVRLLNFVFKKILFTIK